VGKEKERETKFLDVFTKSFHFWGREEKNEQKLFFFEAFSPRRRHPNTRVRTKPEGSALFCPSPIFRMPKCRITNCRHQITY
jgi:hypothetical protein